MTHYVTTLRLIGRVTRCGFVLAARPDLAVVDDGATCPICIERKMSAHLRNPEGSNQSPEIEP